MKKIFLFTTVLMSTLVLPACSKKNKMYSAAHAPACLKAKIEQFSKSAASCPNGASMKQYTFQNKTVYVFDPGHCGADMASRVVDAQCNDIGSLGGFTGNMKVNGEDFSSATYVKTVWSN